VARKTKKTKTNLKTDTYNGFTKKDAEMMTPKDKAEELKLQQELQKIEKMTNKEKAEEFKLLLENSYQGNEIELTFDKFYKKIEKIFNRIVFTWEFKIDNIENLITEILHQRSQKKK